MTTLALALFAAMAFTGCGQEAVREHREAVAAGELEALADSFHGELVLCRKLSRKSGRPIGAATEFQMSEKSAVEALVDFRNAEPGKTYTVHMVWLKPGGKEMFRKYAEVRLEPVGEGYRSVIHWRKAEDLNSVKEEIQESAEPAFSLSTKLNTSLKRNREPGEYSFRVYLWRELYLEQAFTLGV
jgi:hypothetical protein